VQFEDRQIIRRFLDRDFPFRGLLLSLVVSRTALVAQDGSDRFQVQQHAAAVNQCWKDLIHMPADLEDQVATVLHLIVRVLVVKPAALLLLRVERETQAGGINPTLADLAQPPYNPLSGQGVCDLCQACGVRDIRKTVSFFCKADPSFAGLAGHVLMTVQDHLGRERRMPTDFNGDVTPVGIQNMK